MGQLHGDEHIDDQAQCPYPGQETYDEKYSTQKFPKGRNIGHKCGDAQRIHKLSCSFQTSSAIPAENFLRTMHKKYHAQSESENERYDRMIGQNSIRKNEIFHRLTYKVVCI